MLRFRVDDFPGTKPDEFGEHNLENFLKFYDVMASHGVVFTLGIIPRHSTDEQLKALYGKSMFGCLIPALHGVDHDERFLNEFRDHMTRDQIRDSLAAALSRLERFVGPVGTYIPPHNVIDRKTVDALSELGFNEIMGGPGTDPSVFDYARKKGLKTSYSREPLEYGRSDELLWRGSAVHLRDRRAYDDVVLTLHWTWEWNIGLENLKKYLSVLLA